MTMKTPAEIADEKLQRNDGGLYVLYEGNATTFNIPERDADLVRRAMILAIKADRAHRAADAIVLADAASKWATELTDYIIPSAEESDAGDAKAYEAERDEIQEVLGRHLAEEPEGDAAPMCKNCGEGIEDDDMHADRDMCGSCNHNAVRSGA